MEMPMSVARIPFAFGDLKSVGDRLEEDIDRINAALGPEATVNFTLMVTPGPAAPPMPGDKAPKPPRRQRPKTDTDTYTPIEHTLYSLQAFGFTHPSSGRYLMAPKE